jgi:hypothetical protein
MIGKGHQAIEMRKTNSLSRCRWLNTTSSWLRLLSNDEWLRNSGAIEKTVVQHSLSSFSIGELAPEVKLLLGESISALSPR